MKEIIYILIGGGTGAILRYLISGLVHESINTSFPMGTLVVNLVGAFVLGFLWGISEMFIVSTSFKLIFFIGFLGAFTTFSTFMLESVNLARFGEIKYALLNLLISNVFGIILVFFGLIISKYFVKIVGWR